MQSNEQKSSNTRTSQTTPIPPRRRTELFDEPQDLSDEFEDKVSNMLPDHLIGTYNRRPDYQNTKMMDNSALMEANRKSLRKFEALNLNGNRLTGMSIGGFEIDFNAAATKAMEVLPLPPSKLPIIFVDEELNFYHHFFQGMTYIMGQEVLEEVVSQTIHYDTRLPIIIPVIEELVETGYERSDTELMIFLKRVFTTTFELLGKSRRNHSSEEVMVVANLWGFQYIESGMKCSEASLKMWLSMCYNHYRTVWFNTFKSTGVPGFATQGVRGSRGSTFTYPGVNPKPELTRENVDQWIRPLPERSIEFDQASQRTSGTRRRRKQSGANAMIRYMRT